MVSAISLSDTCLVSHAAVFESRTAKKAKCLPVRDAVVHVMNDEGGKNLREDRQYAVNQRLRPSHPRVSLEGEENS